MPFMDDKWIEQLMAERAAKGDWVWKEFGWNGVTLSTPPEPQPSFEERVARCKDMGLVICTCSSVERDGDRLMLYSSECPIHGSRSA